MGKEKRDHPHKKTCHVGIRDILIMAVEDIAVSIGVSWVFYDSPLAMVLVIPIAIVNTARYTRSREAEREKRFMGEYQELLLGLVNALETGYSVENAFCDAEDNLRKLYGDQGILAEEIHSLNTKVSLHMPVEKAFSELAADYPYEEVTSFAGIFSFAKRLGGDYIGNIRKTAAKIEEKVDLKQEITASLAEKQLELKVMLVMPAAIIAYVKLSSPEFLKPMYGNLGGVLAMSACIAVYIAAMMIGERIVDIEI